MVRNINTAAEGEIVMTDEQLQQALQEASAGIAKLSKSDKPLTKEEKKYRARLQKRKNILGRIKEAREKNQKEMELYHTTIYDFLVPWGEKHPFLMFFMMSMMRARWSSGLMSFALRESAKRKEK